MDHRTTNIFGSTYMASSSLTRSRAVGVLLPLPQSVFFEKMRMLPFSLLIANGHFGRLGWTVMNNCHSKSDWKCAQLNTAVERERDPSGCRPSGLTPELPVHIVLVLPLLVPPLFVPSLLVPPLLRFPALVPMVQCQPHRVCYFLDCPRKFQVSSSPAVVAKKSSGFYSCLPPYCPVDASSLVFFAAPQAYM